MITIQPLSPEDAPAQLHGLPPIRYADRARAAGVEITLSVWEGMPHVFQSPLGQFLAAEQSVTAIADFLRQRLIDASSSISTPSEV